MSTELAVAARVIADVAVIAGVLLAYRWCHGRSPRLARILAAGILIRAVAGVALFTISFFGLPVLSALQSGGGFWKLAIDARYYFNTAAVAARGGPPIAARMPSPAFLHVLVGWMDVFGIGPASAVLLNVVCFALTGLLIVKAAEARPFAGSAALAAISLSPALVVFSTQALKDSVFVLAIGIMLFGMWLWCGQFDQAKKPKWTVMVVAGTITACGMIEIAGIRAYVGAFAILALVAISPVLIVRRKSGRWHAVIVQGAMVIALFLAFQVGAGDYYQSYQNAAVETLVGKTGVVRLLNAERAAFVKTGGATSIGPAAKAEAGPSPEAPAVGMIHEAKQPSGHVTTLFRRLAVGGIAAFIPISLAKSLGLVSFSGGRGLLAITDVDTIWMDVFLIAAMYLTARSVPRAWRDPMTLFIVGLSVAMAMAMVYTVTNFGTLFRLRLVFAVPFWLLPAFAGSRGKLQGESKPLTVNTAK